MPDTLWEIGDLLAPRAGRFEFATRLALICALTVLIAEIYQTPEPALAAYVVFFLNREDRTTSLIMNFALVGVATLIISLVLLVAMVAADDPMWRVISMAVLSFGFLFLASGSKLRPIGATLALIAGYALDQLGTVQVGEQATRGLLYAWLFAGIPAGASIVVNFLFAPPPRRLAERAIALRLELCGAMLCAPDKRIRRKFRECLREGAVEIQKRLSLAEREKTSTLKDIDALRHAADSTVVLLSAVEVMDRYPEAFLPSPAREYVARTLQEMAAVLSTGAYPIEIAWEAPDADHQLAPLAADVLADIKASVVRFAGPPDPDAGVEDKPKKSRRFFRGRRLHQSRTCPLCVEDDGRRDALLLPVLVARLAEHPYLLPHLLRRLARDDRGDHPEAHAANPRLPHRRRGRDRRDRFFGSVSHLDRLVDDRSLSGRLCGSLCGRRQFAHFVRRIPDGLCILSVRRSGTFTRF